MAFTMFGREKGQKTEKQKIAREQLAKTFDWEWVDAGPSSWFVAGNHGMHGNAALRTQARRELAALDE